MYYSQSESNYFIRGSKMKLNVIGYKRIKGDKSKAGNPYDIPNIFGAAPVELSSTDKMQVTGKGYEPVEIPYDASVFPTDDFDKLPFPCVVELVMDSRPRFGKFESIAVGFSVLKG